MDRRRKRKSVDSRRQPRRPARHQRPAPAGGQNLADWPISSCDCRICRQACLNSPGWFLPEELPPVADFLDCSLEEAFRRYLAVGTTYMPDRSRRRGVMPHKLQDRKKPGSLWTLPELSRPGRCIFYDRGRCAIYPVRPFECSRMSHARPDEAMALRHLIVGRWMLPELKPYLVWARQRRR